MFKPKLIVFFIAGLAICLGLFLVARDYYQTKIYLNQLLQVNQQLQANLNTYAKQYQQLQDELVQRNMFITQLEKTTNKIAHNVNLKLKDSFCYSQPLPKEVIDELTRARK